MNELIKIEERNGEQLVSSRELYDFLELSERFSKWWDRMIGYGFVEGTDYTPYQKVHPQNKQIIDDYVIKLDMAKELSMLQRTEKGKQARLYFIECEKKLKEMAQPKLPTTYLEALKELVAKEEALLLATQIIKGQKPKVEYHDKVLDTGNCYTTTQIAKELEMSARQLNIMLNHIGVQFKQSGQWLLTKKYQDKGYVKTRTHLFKNKNGNEETRHATVWTEKGRKFLLELSEDF